MVERLEADEMDGGESGRGGSGGLERALKEGEKKEEEEEADPGSCFYVRAGTGIANARPPPSLRDVLATSGKLRCKLMKDSN